MCSPNLFRLHCLVPFFSLYFPWSYTVTCPPRCAMWYLKIIWMELLLFSFPVYWVKARYCMMKNEVKAATIALENVWALFEWFDFWFEYLNKSFTRSDLKENERLLWGQGNKNSEYWFLIVNSNALSKYFMPFCLASGITHLS